MHRNLGNHGLATKLEACTYNRNNTGSDVESVPMNTILLTRASFPHTVECSLSNSSYTPWTITRLVSLVTDTTPCFVSQSAMFINLKVHPLHIRGRIITLHQWDAQNYSTVSMGGPWPILLCNLHKCNEPSFS